jgi:Nuclease-related domain
MYPAELPEHVLNHPLRGEEIKVFKALEKLPEGFHVFYNGALRSGQFIEAHERPVDFILLHPKWMLCIEVKGGQIRVGESGLIEQFIPKTRNWHRINPERQVQVALFKLIEACRADGAKYWLPEDCCVVFPDTRREQFTSQQRLIPAGFFFAEDLDNLATSLPRLLAEKYQLEPDNSMLHFCDDPNLRETYPASFCLGASKPASAPTAAEAMATTPSGNGGTVGPCLKSSI